MKVVKLVRVFEDGSAELLDGEELKKFLEQEGKALTLLLTHLPPEERKDFQWKKLNRVEVSRLVKETDEETGEYSKLEKPIDSVLKSQEEDRCPFCAYTISQHELPWFCLISQVRDCESPCTVDDWKRCPLRNVPHQKIVDYLR